MKIVAISDTHSLHDRVIVPEGDVLIHAGDFSNRMDEQEAAEFLAWFAAHPHPDKILIAGNHDRICEDEPTLFNELLAPYRIHYLNDSGVKIGDRYFWGSPVQPEFMNWAFNRKRGAEIKKHWDLIPAYTDVLITHGPPFGVLDQCAPHLGSEHLGCKDLKTAVERLWPDLHIFGHIHGSYGLAHDFNCRFYNAAQCNEAYKVVNKPIMVDL